MTQPLHSDVAASGLPGRAAVEWRDLLELTWVDRVREVCLSLPWLGLSWVLADRGWFVPAWLASAMFFLTALRQVHGAYHHSLGISRRGDHVVQLVWSALMLGAIHAIGVNHLRHHRLRLGEGDEEGYPARLPWWGAVLYGPVFIVRCTRNGWRHARPAVRRWIAAELAITACIAGIACAAPWTWLRYHVATMIVANALTAYFCVWTVHRGTVEVGDRARTCRGRLANFSTANMFLHDEHHAYPAVPTRRLHELAARLDSVQGSAPLRVF